MKDKFYLRLIWGISLLIVAVVVILFNLPKAASIPPFVKILPTLNAFLNGTTAVLLCLSYICIKNQIIHIHKWLNITAFCLSTIFLFSYVLFHSYGIETKYPVSPLKPVYLVILTSHILCAATVLPLVLLSLYRGLSMQVHHHRRIARWAFPVWLYVSVTGVIVYLMISPHYSF